jgi:hypothetical protein
MWQAVLGSILNKGSNSPKVLEVDRGGADNSQIAMLVVGAVVLIVISVVFIKLMKK